MNSFLHHLFQKPAGETRYRGATGISRLGGAPVLIPVLLLFMCLVLVSGCAKQAAPGAPPPAVVSVQEVTPAAAEHTIQTTGLVKPWKEARLSFQVPGKISQGPPQEGTAAGAGAVLARLDQADYRARVDAARHQLELARVEVERTLADLQRAERLFEAAAIPEKDLEDAQFAHRAALARAGQAESALDRAELALDYTTLQAPFAGEVLKKLVEQGEMVAEGMPVLLLGQLDPVKISVSVAAGEMENWPVGAQAVVTTGPVAGTGASGGDQQREAVVHNVSPGAEGYTGAFEVTLKVANPHRGLRPGQVVGVERKVKTAEALWIPLKAVVSRGEELKYVFLYRPEDETVKQQPVRLGEVAGDRVRVLEGLAPGDQLVVMMPGDLKDGARVEVKENGTH